jgi:predicted metal-dependent RNase
LHRYDTSGELYALERKARKGRRPNKRLALKLSFHGADRSVTGSCHLIECAGKRILIDCGLR